MLYIDRFVDVAPPKMRQFQRRAHIVTGMVIVMYVYATPPADSIETQLVRWIALPALVVSGLAMWQLHRLRRFLRQRRAGA